MGIHIDAAIQQAMLDQAAEGYPNEVCGLLMGRWLDGEGVGHSYHPCSNRVAEQKGRRFLIAPEFYRRLEDQADAQGLSIISIVHSHPDHPDRPSEFDRSHAWPGVSYIIISVASGRVVSCSSWLLRQDRSGFDPEQIVVEPRR